MNTNHDQGQGHALVSYEAPEVLALPSREAISAQLRAVGEFQLAVRETFVEGHDFGRIPRTERPTLLQPGAQKLAKLLGLADTYQHVSQIEDWDRPLFSFTIKCQLRTIREGLLVAEGFGNCNSREARYAFRWAWPRDVSESERSRLAELGRTRELNTRNGLVTQYRIDNEDPFTLVNTFIKMAAKRALVAAALSAGRLSDVFTQDLEDLGEEQETTSSAAPTERPAPPRPAASRAPSRPRLDPRLAEGSERVETESDPLFVAWRRVGSEARTLGIQVMDLKLPTMRRGLYSVADSLATAVAARRGATATEASDGNLADGEPPQAVQEAVPFS